MWARVISAEPSATPSRGITLLGPPLSGSPPQPAPAGTPPREVHEAVAAAKAGQTSQHWKQRYNIRAGVESTMRQATHITGIRTARCIGLDKTSLEHAAAAAAVNLLRLDAWWIGKPLDRTRTAHLQRLDFSPAA